VGLGQRRHPLADALTNRGRPPGRRVDVHEYVLTGRHRLIFAPADDRVEQVQPPVVPAEHLGGRIDAVARVQLAHVAYVRLGGVVAPAGGEVGGVDADQAEQRVGRVAEQLQIAELGDMAVVVDPIRGNLAR
jgi:hypothetical protein